jgi:hypothetical protein
VARPGRGELEQGVRRGLVEPEQALQLSRANARAASRSGPSATNAIYAVAATPTRSCPAAWT